MPSAKERREARNERIQKAEQARALKKQLQAATPAPVPAPKPEQTDEEKLAEFREVDRELKNLNNQINNVKQDAKELGMAFIRARGGNKAHFLKDGDGAMIGKLRPLLQQRKKLNKRWEELHMVDPYWQENQAKKDFWSRLAGDESGAKKPAKQELQVKKRNGICSIPFRFR